MKRARKKGRVYSFRFTLSTLTQSFLFSARFLVFPPEGLFFGVSALFLVFPPERLFFFGVAALFGRPR